MECAIFEKGCILRWLACGKQAISKKGIFQDGTRAASNPSLEKGQIGDGLRAVQWSFTWSLSWQNGPTHVTIYFMILQLLRRNATIITDQPTHLHPSLVPFFVVISYQRCQCTNPTVPCILSLFWNQTVSHPILRGLIL